MQSSSLATWWLGTVIAPTAGNQLERNGRIRISICNRVNLPWSRSHGESFRSIYVWCPHPNRSRSKGRGKVGGEPRRRSSLTKPKLKNTCMLINRTWIMAWLLSMDNRFDQKLINPLGAKWKNQKQLCRSLVSLLGYTVMGRNIQKMSGLKLAPFKLAGPGFLSLCPWLIQCAVFGVGFDLGAWLFREKLKAAGPKIRPASCVLVCRSTNGTVPCSILDSRQELDA